MSAYNKTHGYNTTNKSWYVAKYAKTWGLVFYWHYNFVYANGAYEDFALQHIKKQPDGSVTPMYTSESIKITKEGNYSIAAGEVYPYDKLKIIVWSKLHNVPKSVLKEFLHVYESRFLKK